MKEKIYLSGPLFSQAEIEWGRQIKACILDAFGNRAEVIWPHEMTSTSSLETFQSNLQALSECRIMVAILDGPQVDDGTSWEIGYHYARGGKIIGIRTDYRKAGEAAESKVNLMIEHSCLVIVNSQKLLVSRLMEILGS
jgi:nucleoside 2-deoxyribosyltransferase